MPKLVYTRVNTPDVNNITVYKVPNFDDPFSADSGHPHWDEILRRVESDDAEVLDLFNIANTLMRDLVSERVQIAHGRMFFDGDEVDESLSDFVVGMMAAGNPNYQAFVKFVEKLYSNPQEHSRNHLFGYLRKYNISISTEGDLILYKGVYPSTTGESFGGQKPYRSGSRGPANVSGYEHTNGFVPQAIGDIVSMPRSITWTAPTVQCSTGLHVACWGEWHTSYPRDLMVLVNPRDVVSVPHDGAKIRCCRYRIVRDVPRYTEGVDRKSNPLPHPVNEVTIPEVPLFDPDRSEPLPTETLKQVAVAIQQPMAGSKSPSRKEFAALKEIAKAQRKGLEAYMTRKGWKLHQGAHGTANTDWYKSN